MRPAARADGATARREIGPPAAALRGGIESAGRARGAEADERPGQAREGAVGRRERQRQATGGRIVERS